MKAKQEVANLLTRLPNSCSLEDVQYHLYVLQKIKNGLEDIKKGRTYTTAQVKKRLSKWLSK